MSMIPALTPLVQPRLMYSTTRTRQTSPVQHNFVLEHFGDTTCTEVYEVHGSSKLGKGSYGSVYLATHRVTGILISHSIFLVGIPYLFIHNH